MLFSYGVEGILMSDEASKIPASVIEAAGILRKCLPLATRLMQEGVMIALNKAEEDQLISFEKLTLQDFSEQDWRYLRLSSGVNIQGVSSLHSCLRVYRSQL
jgi:hypothetical protein